MSKKSKVVPDKTQTFGIIKRLQTSNFQLFNKNEINFHSGLNIINSSSLIDKIVLNFILKLFLNPDFRNNNKKIEPSLFNIFQDIKLVAKKDISFSIVLVIPKAFLINVGDNFKSNFLENNEISIQAEINIHHDIVLKVYNGSQKKFVTLTPNQEYQFSELIYNNIWIDHAIYPYLDSEKLFEILKYDYAQLFEFFLYHLNLGDLKNEYKQLKEKFNLTILERGHFSDIRQVALKKKDELENELKLLKQAEEIDNNIKKLELESEWSNYFDLKSKFQGKTANMDQITSKLPGLITEKENLESRSQDVVTKLETLRNDLETTTTQYDNQRKSYLSEKALLDKIDRNLKDWDKNVTKTEKDLKFKSMKLTDKEKKLKDLNTRISKQSTESLVTQREKLEKEITKDQNEISNLQQALQAIQNEKNLKSKERASKEKNSQPKSVLLAEISSKMKSYTEGISENEKELDKLQEQIQNLNFSIKKYQNEIEISKKEIKELDKAISKEMDNLKAKNLDLPVINRSLSTINVLKEQLINEKNELLSLVHSETNTESYSKHLSLLNDLKSEFSKRDVEIDKLTKSLLEWNKKWYVTFNEEMKKIKDLSNEFLKGFKLSIDLSLPGSDKPDEGILDISMILHDKEAVIPYSLHKVSNESITSLICMVFSLSLVNKTKLYISDFIDVAYIPQLEFQTLLAEFTNRLEKLKSASVDIHPQMIFFVNKGRLSNSSLVSQYSVID